MHYIKYATTERWALIRIDRTFVMVTGDSRRISVEASVLSEAPRSELVAPEHAHLVAAQEQNLCGKGEQTV